MAYNLKEVMANKPSRFTEGHRMCAGCGAPVVARMIMRALKTEDHAVVANATGCMKYQHLYIHIQHGQTLLSIQHLKMQEQLVQEQKQHINQ